MIATLVLAAVLSGTPTLPTPTAPAVRLDLDYLRAEAAVIGVALEIVPEGTPGDCETYKPLALAAGWDESDWPVLRVILNRETWHCHPDAINRYGCSGLMQVCRVNQARLGVTRWDLQDPLTNLTIGRELCAEQESHHRSCWRPWWTRRWRP